MAATDGRTGSPGVDRPDEPAAHRPRVPSTVPGAVLAAALALPGLAPSAAHAENPPEKTSVAFKFLHYREHQPGHDRIKVDAPSLQVEAPLGEHWSIESSAVVDSVSGASPRYYTNMVSGASRMHDSRTAWDVSMTRFEARSAYTVSVSHSGEHDYVSDAVGLNARWASADQNTTLNAGVGWSNDSISKTLADPSDTPVDERRRTREFLVGVTQALSKADLVQANFSHSLGRGDFSDHYKDDVRPTRRAQNALLLRWHHHVEPLGATLRSSYRYYRDSWKLRSHTAQLEWVQPLGERWVLTPLLRLYSQSAAEFYVDPVLNGAGLPMLPLMLPEVFTADQRLAAFGAITLGLRVDVDFMPGWRADLKGELYRQRSGWRVGGEGSPDLAPFEAVTIQWGVRHEF